MSASHITSGPRHAPNGRSGAMSPSWLAPPGPHRSDGSAFASRVRVLRAVVDADEHRLLEEGAQNAPRGVRYSRPDNPSRTIRERRLGNACEWMRRSSACCREHSEAALRFMQARAVVGGRSVAAPRRPAPPARRVVQPMFSGGAPICGRSLVRARIAVSRLQPELGTGVVERWWSMVGGVRSRPCGVGPGLDGVAERPVPFAIVGSVGGGQDSARCRGVARR